MRAIAIGIAMMVLGAATSPAARQPHPDLSGSWVASKSVPGDLPAASSPVFGARLWLRQTGDRLTVIRLVRETTVTATFPMDGTEVRTRIPGGICRGDAESIEAVAWQGSDLAFTIVGSIPPGGGPPSKMSTKRLLRLQAPDTLVVEATMRDSAPGESRQVGTVYTRSSDSVPPSETSSTSQPTKATLPQVGWISGVWIGTTGSVTVEERWTPASGGAMLATARTLRGTAMTNFEFLCIAERGGGLVYTAMPNARTPATDFTLTTITADSATFENPKHDFPKLIRYTRRADGSLETVVGAGGKTETVVLKRSRD